MKNSYQAKEELSKIKVSQDESLVSFDVKALFPSVPIKLALEKADKVLEENPDLLKQQTNLERHQVMDLLTLCTEA